MSKPKWQCIVPGCTSKRHSCGNCIACDTKARRLIKAGETTSEELIRKKLRLAPKRTGRPGKSKMAKVLAK